ncbi:MAG: LytTR family DNA-binding domain-containing protein [Spirosomataceae bacterium]
MKILIADDEPIARDLLLHFLRKQPDTEVISVCTNGQEALEAIRQHQPDLAFLDIQMPELNGLELAKQLQINRLPVVVFVTAFDQYALQAFEANAIDYLLKPFDEERFDKTFQKAVQQYELLKKQPVDTLFEQYRTLFEQLTPPSYPELLTVRDGGRIHLIKVTELTHLEADGNYVEIHTDKAKHLLSEPLSHVENRLNPKQFVRIHRSTLVNIHAIKEIQSHFNGDYSVILKNGKVLRMSRTYKDRLIGG